MTKEEKQNWRNNRFLYDKNICMPFSNPHCMAEQLPLCLAWANVCVRARVCMWAANVQMFIRRQWLFVNYCSLDVLYLSASLRSAFTFQYFENESKNGFIYMTITTINCRRIDFFFFRHKRLHEVEHFLSHIFFFSQISPWYFPPFLHLLYVKMFRGYNFILNQNVP